MKAQVAIEFIIIFAVFLVALTIVVLASWNNIANINKSAIEFEANRVLSLVSAKINTVYLEGNGFSMGLVVPERIGLINYTVAFEGSTMWLNMEGKSYSRKLLTSNITGTLNKGSNTLENVNGEIVIS